MWWRIFERRITKRNLENKFEQIRKMGENRFESW